MKSEVTAAEPIQSTTALLNFGGLSPRAESCLAAEDDESAAKYLCKLSHDVILSLDRAGNILCINQRGVQLSGYSDAEMRGRKTAQERREISGPDRNFPRRDLCRRCAGHLCFGKPRRR